MSRKKKEPVYQYVKSMLNNPVLDYRVYVMGKKENLIVRLILLVIGGCVGLVFYGGLFKSDGQATMATYISNAVFFVLVGTIAGYVFVPIYKNRKVKKRQEILRSQFRNMLEALSTSFSAGSNVQDSFISALNDLSMQYKPSDYIIVEMQEIVNGIMSNMNVEKLISYLAERSGNEDISTFAEVFEVCFRKGGDMKVVVRHTYEVISDKMSINDEIETKLTSNKIQHNAMSVIPVAIVGLLRLSNPGMAANFVTPVGVVTNTIAIGVFIAAYLYGRKIIDIKE